MIKEEILYDIFSFILFSIGQKDKSNIIVKLNMDFKIGDIVILKSDKYRNFPTIMTVNEVDMGKVTCVWSTKERDFIERIFSADALEQYE